MSHFKMLVVGDVEYNLAPFHEYECTGIKDEFVKRVPSEDYTREEYLETDDIPMIVSKINGEVLGMKYDSKFEPFWERKHDYCKSSEDKLVLPGAFEEKRIKATEVYPTYEEYLKEWCGVDLDGDHYELEDNVLYTFTNPDAQWDWYQVGGRYSDYLVTKEGYKTNSCKVKDLDLSFYSSEYEKQRLMMSYKQAMKEKEEGSIFAQLAYGIEKDETLEQYVERRARFSVFGFVKDRKWSEKADMGWFGCTSDEKDDSDWFKELEDFVSSLDPEETITIVDCHI